MNKDAVNFARLFLTKMLTISNDTLRQPWQGEQSAQVLRARVRALATDTAYQCGVHLDAADALATYALATLTIDGQTLESREETDRLIREKEAELSALRSRRGF
jgi:hypothetical protein